ncbi:hypothetical protein Tco_1529149 [Tanacetum coccineum]
MVVLFIHRSKPPSWCEGGDMGGGGIIAMAVSRGDGGDGEVMERVRESEVSGWIDRLTRNIFGVHRKTPPEKFSGGGWPERWAAGGGEGSPEIMGRERGGRECVCVFEM